MIDPAAVAEFAALFLPPGHTMERGTVELFVSEAKLKKTVAQRPRPKDVWKSSCVDRLERLLAGEDPMEV